MADVIDRANDEFDNHLQRQIQTIRNSVKSPIYTGYCLTCGEKIPEPRRWCDKECCDAYEG